MIMPHLTVHKSYFHVYYKDRNISKDFPFLNVTAAPDT